jgi:hypothetical protein
MMDNSAFTKELLEQAIKRIQMPLVTFEPLEKYLADGGKMTDTLTMITSQEGFKDIPQINTIHGILKIQYSKHIPTEALYFMSPPKLEDLFKPDFKIKLEDTPTP